MDQDVDNEYRNVCSTCLSSDRDLFSLSNIPQVFQTFKLLMYDFAGDRLGELPDISHLICWECVAVMKRLNKFKWQVHNAQEHIQVLALSQTQETMDHTYMTQSLSSLVVEIKSDYDKIFFDYTSLPECQFIMTDPMDVKNEQFVSLKDSIGLDVEEHILEVPQIDDTEAEVFSHVVLESGALVSMPEALSHVKCEMMPTLTIAPITTSTIEAGTVIMSTPKEEMEPKSGYSTEYMDQEQMLASREDAKKKVQYASSVYKCELCAIGFYTQQQVEDHFENAHRPKPGLIACKVCYVYIDASAMTSHVDQHYLKYTCKLCAHSEYGQRLMQIHMDSHRNKPTPPAVIKIEGTDSKKSKKKKGAICKAEPIKPGDLRKLLSKTTIEGYKCLECDMFFKNSRARKNHVARYHREGLQCDHCKKRFVNRTTLATHLRLHEGPLPRAECPICHKQVRCIQLKYHILRHESRSRYSCADCDKVFAHLATYRAHLKYSRAHATDHVLKFPCPMCSKGYPTKEAMQDHFNYQHLGKTSHKCPICSKPIASRANVEKHISRVHGEKKPKPRNHQCQTCGKSFTDKKALTQHEVIHSGVRPLSCDICHQTFKQKASLYTHKKRVHKVYPVKKQVHYMDELPT